MTPSTPVKTVLVIDDDDATCDAFGATLSSRGYRVILAVNGVEALDYLHNSPAPDLIVLAMLTPGMDGWKFLKERDARWSSIPVLIATALGIASDEWATSLGAVGLIRKPVDPDVLLERVEKCLGSIGQGLQPGLK